MVVMRSDAGETSFEGDLGAQRIDVRGDGIVA